MIGIIKADPYNSEGKDGYEIPFFHQARKPEVKEESYRSVQEMIRARHRNLFWKTLCEFLDAKKLDDVEVYKKANVSRQLYSKIRNGHIPKKNVVLAFGMTMRLNKAEMDYLLNSAGYALTDTRRTDIVVTWCISQGIYDVGDVNRILYANNAKLLQ